VLIDDRSSPAVIDFSPYWHPEAWAEAVVVADAMLSSRADSHLTEAIGGGNRGRSAQIAQLMLRAVLFRVVTRVLAGQDPADNADGTTVIQLITAAASVRT
jgi:hypothetical protein